MKRWGQRLLVFGFIAALIVGGLGWATAEALRLERDRREAHAREGHAVKLRLALGRLDGRIAPLLAREDSRPYAHFTPLHAPIPALGSRGESLEPGRVLIPSPLMDAELPEWMLLHFQVDAKSGWRSPQVMPEKLARSLRWPPSSLTLPNVTPQRAELLADLAGRYSHSALLVEVKKRGQPATTSDPVRDVVMQNSTPIPGQSANAPPWSQQNDMQRPIQGYDVDQQKRNDSYQRMRGGKEQDSVVATDPFSASKTISCIQTVQLGAMTPLWLPSAETPDHLLFVRLTNVDSREVVQGVVLDWQMIDAELRETAADLFPEARLVPLPDGVPAHPERVMTALPVQFDPGPEPAATTVGLTPLRIGLGVAWAAVAAALLAIGLGGWSLIDLSERRIRFVSAVTHELRTPLTTLRLYLDMLTSGMIRDEAQRDDYLRTLGAESERLHRLVSNVLDYARLEKQSASLTAGPVAVCDLVEQLRATWRERCQTAGKVLVVENNVPASSRIQTDGALVQQIVGNLIDNACKYSQAAPDRRIWLRALPAGSRSIGFEVEDCGPGVPTGERRSIFRPFRRGFGADVTAGGVGLGLALARRWTSMLGGRLEVGKGACAGGACFRLELPHFSFSPQMQE